MSLVDIGAGDCSMVPRGWMLGWKLPSKLVVQADLRLLRTRSLKPELEVHENALSFENRSVVALPKRETLTIKPYAWLCCDNAAPPSPKRPGASCRAYCVQNSRIRLVLCKEDARMELCPETPFALPNSIEFRICSQLRLARGIILMLTNHAPGRAKARPIHRGCCFLP